MLTKKGNKFALFGNKVRQQVNFCAVANAKGHTSHEKLFG